MTVQYKNNSDETVAAIILVGEDRFCGPNTPTFCRILGIPIRPFWRSLVGEDHFCGPNTPTFRQIFRTVELL